MYKEDVESILDKLTAIGDCPISLETSQGLYSNIDVPEWNAKVCDDLMKIPDLGAVCKILVSSERHNLKEVLEKCISKNVYYTIANNDLFQIMSSRATKWNGIETVLNAYGIDVRDIMYFGDDYDDIEPIMRSGFGVAVSNAIEEVKEIADCIIDSNENDGMAKYINEAVLID